MTEETRAWLFKAEQDLEAAEVLLARRPPLIEPALFHCQQAAEKSLKAYLVWHNQPFAKTHDLVALLSLCISIEPQFTALEAATVALTPLAVSFRYPGEVPTPTEQHSNEALKLARDVFSFVLGRLPPDVTAQP
ncbi:MAG: HEPN domain-containing protein [Chloroflexi bacterium]|nr:HEPN domain-containing protein [Chloroflexota bacterium]